MDNRYVFLVVILIAVLFILTIPIAILTLIYKFLHRKTNQYVAIIFVASVIIYIVYSSYIAIYPTNSFYAGEFYIITARKLPASAKILLKKASYPDFHGDYGSVSIIELSSKDFNHLENELLKDVRFISSDLEGSDEINFINNNYKHYKIKVGLIKRVKRQDRFYYIGFLDDNKTIIINIEKS